MASRTTATWDRGQMTGTLIWPLAPSPALLALPWTMRVTLLQCKSPGAYDLSGVPGYWLVVRTRQGQLIRV